MPAITLRGFVLLLATTSILGVAAMVALPHDKFLRYQALSDGTAPTAYWIYQRIHDDATPIDVAFIGTSRTGMALHSRRLEDELQQRGVTAKAVNLYIVKTGINLQYVVAKELLEARTVKLLVLEMDEREDRKPHPDFIYLADTADVLAAPLLANLNYLADIARLPGRQADLFIQTRLQGSGLQAPGAFPPRYEGPNLDHGQFITTLDGTRHDRRVVNTQAQMATLLAADEARITPPLLPPSMADIEFRLPRYYTARILDLAKAHGVRVAFLYTPRFGGPQWPQPYRQYAVRAELINPWERLQDYRLWSDVSHVNWDGAQRLTDYVAEALANHAELRH